MSGGSLWTIPQHTLNLPQLLSLILCVEAQLDGEGPAAEVPQPRGEVSFTKGLGDLGDVGATCCLGGEKVVEEDLWAHLRFHGR